MFADASDDAEGGSGNLAEILKKFGSPAGYGVDFPWLGGKRLIKQVSFGRPRRKHSW